jgi:hypothetical protein
LTGSSKSTRAVSHVAGVAFAPRCFQTVRRYKKKNATIAAMKSTVLADMGVIPSVDREFEGEGEGVCDHRLV